MILRAILASGLALGILPCQKTLVVDPTGAGDYTCIQPAIDAASPGDTVLVVNTCSGFGEDVVIDKGIRVLSAGSQIALASLAIHSIPAGQAATIRGFSLYFDYGLGITGSVGAVTCEDLTIRAGPNAQSLNTAVAVRDCSLVTFKDCLLIGDTAAYLSNSTVVFAGCDLRGQSAHCFGSGGFWGSSPGIFAIDSKILVSNSQLRGGRGDYPLFPNCSPSPAIQLTRGSLQVCGGELVHGAGSSVTPTPAPIEGTGLVTYEQGLHQCADIPNMLCEEVLLPCVLSSPAIRGSSLTVELVAPEGSFTCLLVGRPVLPVPTPFGDLWFGLSWTRPIYAGQIPVGGLLSANIDPVPPGLPLGAEFVLQAGVVDGQEVGLSPPVPIVVR
jgi:hypothetical protein